MNIKHFLILIIFMAFNAVGQNRVDRTQKEIEWIVNSYKEHSDRSESIKQTMVRSININQILLLRNYSDEILRSFDVTYFNEKDYYFLCFFDTLPDTIIDMSLKNNTTPLIFKAKYGDSCYTQKLLNKIEKYFFVDNNEEIYDTERLSYEYMSYLFLLKNEKSKNILYKILESKKYTKSNLYDGRQNYKISLSYIAIGYYLAFNPPTHQISKIDSLQFEVKEGKPIFSENDINMKDFNQYKNDIETYISNLENNKVTINTTFFNLGEYKIEKYINP